MTFVQIVSFRTDHPDRVAALDQEWQLATRGRSTVLDERLYVDRADPRHYVVVNEFADHGSAMANSMMPETDELARQVAALADGPVDYLDLDAVAQHDVRHSLAAAMRHDMERSAASEGVFSDDCSFTGLWPHEVARAEGRHGLAAGLQAEAPGRTIDQWDVTTTERGFAVEYRYRTHGEPSYLSVGLVLATVNQGRINRLVVTCGGSWDTAAEARILGATAGAPA